MPPIYINNDLCASYLLRRSHPSTRDTQQGSQRANHGRLQLDSNLARVDPFLPLHPLNCYIRLCIFTFSIINLYFERIECHLSILIMFFPRLISSSGRIQAREIRSKDPNAPIKAECNWIQIWLVSTHSSPSTHLTTTCGCVFPQLYHKSVF